MTRRPDPTALAALVLAGAALELGRQLRARRFAHIKAYLRGYNDGLARRHTPPIEAS